MANTIEVTKTYKKKESFDVDPIVLSFFPVIGAEVFAEGLMSEMVNKMMEEIGMDFDDDEYDDTKSDVEEAIIYAMNVLIEGDKNVEPQLRAMVTVEDSKFILSCFVRIR